MRCANPSEIVQGFGKVRFQAQGLGAVRDGFGGLMLGVESGGQVGMSFSVGGFKAQGFLQVLSGLSKLS